MTLEVDNIMAIDINVHKIISLNNSLEETEVHNPTPPPPPHTHTHTNVGSEQIYKVNSLFEFTVLCIYGHGFPQTNCAQKLIG